MSGDISVITLVDAKQAEEVRWDLVRGGAGLALLEQGVQVVRLAEDCALTDVKTLC